MQFPPPVEQLASLLTRLPETVQQAILANDLVGLRVPAHATILDVLRLLAGPLALTSANHKGEPDAVTGTEVVESLGLGAAVGEAVLRAGVAALDGHLGDLELGEPGRVLVSPISLNPDLVWSDLTRVVPTSMTTAPSGTMSAVRKPGFPMAAMMMSACSVSFLISGVRLWQMMTVQFPGDLFWASSYLRLS